MLQECGTLSHEADERETPMLRPLVWLGQIKKGIATPKPDVDLIKQRYKEAKELAEHEQDER